MVSTSAPHLRFHVNVPSPEYLSSISFSPSESKLVYVAEANATDSTDTDPLAKYRFVPEFGEGYAGKKKPTIFLFEWDIRNDDKPSIFPLSLLQEPEVPLLLAHPVFASEDALLTVGYQYAKDGRLLGVIYCPNRSSAIWHLTLPSSRVGGESLLCSSASLTDPNHACRSPRVLFQNGEATHYTWVSNAVGGPHATCSTLHVMRPSDAPEVVVETVWEPRPNEFPGLYLNTLPVSPFIELGRSSSNPDPHVVLSSIWRSRATVLFISLSDGTVIDLSPDDGTHYSWTVLGTDGRNQVVCTRSAPSRPPELVLGKFDDDNNIHWQVIDRPSVAEDRESFVTPKKHVAYCGLLYGLQCRSS